MKNDGFLITRKVFFLPFFVDARELSKDEGKSSRDFMNSEIAVLLCYQLT